MTLYQRIVLRQLFATAQYVRYAGMLISQSDVRRDSRLADALYWDLVYDKD